VGESVLSCKQLLSRAGFLRFLPVDPDPTSFAYLQPWFEIPQFTDSPYSADTPNTFVTYFVPAYAYARGSCRFTSVPFQKDSFQEVALADDVRALGYNLYSASGYLSECGPLNFTVPFYSNKSRVRITTDMPGVCKVACRSGIDPYAARLSLSAADDAQLGFFLGAPPLLRVPEGLMNSSPCYGWNPTLLDRVGLLPDQQISVVGTVSATIPDNTPVIIRGLDSSSTPQTFASLPNVDGNHFMLTRVDNIVSVSVDNVPDVTVSGVVSATIPDNTPVLIRGLDSASTPQTFAALPNADGNHTMSVIPNGIDVDTPFLPHPISAVAITGSYYNLGSVIIS